MMNRYDWKDHGTYNFNRMGRHLRHIFSPFFFLISHGFDIFADPFVRIIVMTQIVDHMLWDRIHRVPI